MRVLVVDNGTSYLTQLQAALAGCVVEVVAYDALPAGDGYARFDAIVLSGGHAFQVEGSENRLARELALVRDVRVPVLGICYGFELISVAYGTHLERMEKKECGTIEVRVTNEDRLLAGMGRFRVFESHRWVVREVGGDLIELARSDDGIEAIRHRERPVYGVQFHPEMLVEGAHADRVIRAFLDIAREGIYLRA